MRKINYSIDSWYQAFLVSATSILSSVFRFIPTIIGAIIVFIVGLILARWGKIIVTKILSKIRLNKFLKKVGFENFLEKAEIKIRAEEFFGLFVYWLIVIIFSIATLNIFGLTAVSQMLVHLLNYVPKVVSAIIIFTAGFLLAQFVGSVVKGSLGQIDRQLSRMAAKFTRYLLIGIAVLVAINELGIAQSFINTLLIGFVATLVLAFGLSFGLGGKDLVAKLLEDWYKRFKK
ncbi:hypothetical protein MUP35_01320 [Patescibacteria group bacterium]|nr:hypothetical protein [Patescibacteria group bacterium]